jgi:hypothetical protein
MKTKLEVGNQIVQSHPMDGFVQTLEVMRVTPKRAYCRMGYPFNETLEFEREYSDSIKLIGGPKLFKGSNFRLRVGRFLTANK